MGNGAKAQQKRERNAQAGAKSKASQLKVNQEALSVLCDICKQPFMGTVRAPALEAHAQNKHGKGLAECFSKFKES